MCITMRCSRATKLSRNRHRKSVRLCMNAQTNYMKSWGESFRDIRTRNADVEQVDIW